MVVLLCVGLQLLGGRGAGGRAGRSDFIICAIDLRLAMRRVARLPDGVAVVAGRISHSRLVRAIFSPGLTEPDSAHRFRGLRAQPQGPSGSSAVRHTVRDDGGLQGYHGEGRANLRRDHEG